MSNSIKIFNFNARNTLPKLDELSALCSALLCSWSWSCLHCGILIGCLLTFPILILLCPIITYYSIVIVTVMVVVLLPMLNLILILLGPNLKNFPLHHDHHCSYQTFVPLPTLPWTNRSFINQFTIRNSISSSAKRTGSPSLWAKYCSYHKKTLAYLRHRKSKFFSIYPPLPHYVFFSLLLNIFTKPVSIPSLIRNGSPVTSSSCKADVLNQYFSSCFYKSAALLSLWLIIPLFHYKTTLWIFSTT